MDCIALASFAHTHTISLSTVHRHLSENRHAEKCPQRNESSAVTPDMGMRCSVAFLHTTPTPRFGVEFWKGSYAYPVARLGLATAVDLDRYFNNEIVWVIA
jgi:hypothetical protein